MNNWNEICQGRPLSLHDLPEAAGELLNVHKGIRVWKIEGQMGMGKTTLVRHLCRELGITETISSPTFTMVHEYRKPNNECVLHFDFYRLRNEDEAYQIGVDEYFESGNMCWIEWPEKIPSLLPSQSFTVRIHPTTDKNHRIIQYKYQ